MTAEKNIKKNVCVFCSSSDAVNSVYRDAAKELGRLLVANNYGLVYGGGNVGLMGTLADSVKKHDGNGIGVIPQSLKERGLAYERADEMIVTTDMRKRKAVMEKRSDAFICLPGSFGTLEEIMEILTLKQLRYHAFPIVFLNINNFYKPLFDLFEQLYRFRFTRPEYRKLYYITDDCQSALAYIRDYQAEEIPGKWFARDGEKK